MSSLQAQAWLSVPVSADPMDQAEWIWVQRPGEPVPTAGNGAPGTFTFSRSFRLDAPAAAKLRFTADNSARVLVNGREVGRSSEWSNITTVELTDLLVVGNNELRIIATNGTLPAGSMNPGGVLACLEIAGKEVLVTDRQWAVEGGIVAVLGKASIAPWNLAFRASVSPVFRKEFSVEDIPAQAKIEVVGLGHYQIYLNGKRLGRAAINQAWSQYDKTLYSQAFDLTPHLNKGRNVLAVMMGNSFYRVSQPPAGRWSKGDAMPDYSEGEPVRLWIRGFVQSDASWRWTEGPVTLSHIFAGEEFDARLVPSGWMEPGFDATSWQSPKIVAALKAKVVPQNWPGLEVHEVFRPLEVIPASKGGWSYKFAQNCSAILRFRIRGPRGSTVHFKLSEVIDEKGDVEQLNLWNSVALTSYTLAGDGVESYENLFFYHGGQFVGVQGAVPAGESNPDGLPVIESLELVHVRTANPIASSLKTSSPLANQTVDLIDWAMRSNMSFVLTDCPHREKLGWLECVHLLANSFAYRYDCEAWFHKICRDLRDSQLSSGRVLTVAPRYLMRPVDDMYAWTVEWGAASVLLPWQAYQWYGDRRFLTENLPMVRAFVDHLEATSKNLIAHGSLGDWYDYGHGRPPGPSRYTDTRLTATATFAQCALAVADAAEVLGDRATVERYRGLHARIKTAFLREFYNPATKTFANTGSVQTGSAMALYADLVPAEDRAAVLQKIIDELEARDYQQTSGDVGHLYFIRALAESGRSDVLHKVYSRTGIGSYGGIIAKGLTALPETWDAITVGSNSLNHCMLGHAMEWYYGYVLGVRQAKGSVGWAEVLIDPQPGAITSAEGHLDTPKGRVEVNWKRNGGRVDVEFTIPNGMQVTCGGQTFAKKGTYRVSLGSAG